MGDGARTQALHLCVGGGACPPPPRLNDSLGKLGHCQTCQPPVLAGNTLYASCWAGGLWQPVASRHIAPLRPRDAAPGAAVQSDPPGRWMGGSVVCVQGVRGSVCAMCVWWVAVHVIFLKH